MKQLILFLVATICLPFVLFAQNNYSWKEKKITIESPIKLQNENYSGSLFLSGEGITVDISVLGGMEDITGLKGSLESYVSSFDYNSVGTTKQISCLNNLHGVSISTEKENKSIILCLFATTNYKQYFICEIIFSGNFQKTAEAIVNSISFGAKNVLVNPDKIDDNVSEDNHPEKQTGNLDKGSTPPDFILLDISEIQTKRRKC